ncbi:hypothetical protein Tco_1508306 [Tanacetum coccineum]
MITKRGRRLQRYDLQLIMCGDIVKDSNSYLKSRGSIEDFVSFREMITSQLQGKLWLYDEVRTRLCLFCHHQIGEDCWDSLFDETSHTIKMHQQSTASNKPKQKQQQQLIPTTTTISNIKLPILRGGVDNGAFWSMKKWVVSAAEISCCWKRKEGKIGPTILLCHSQGASSEKISWNG